jgi:hypothetical protein
MSKALKCIDPELYNKLINIYMNQTCNSGVVCEEAPVEKVVSAVENIKSDIRSEKVVVDEPSVSNNSENQTEVKTNHNQEGSGKTNNNNNNNYPSFWFPNIFPTEEKTKVVKHKLVKHKLVKHKLVKPKS